MRRNQAKNKDRRLGAPINIKTEAQRPYNCCNDHIMLIHILKRVHTIFSDFSLMA